MLKNCTTIFKTILTIEQRHSTAHCVFFKHLHTKVNFTKEKYDVQRGNYSRLEERDFHYFRDLLGENRITTDLADLEKYNVDWLNYFRGNSSMVLKPKTSEEISQILKFCNERRLAVCVQGGNTSQVGGATPVFDEIIVSLELMNSILGVDEKSSILTCEAGCILQNVNDFLEEKNLIFPLDLGAKGSCQIGGNVSTNAGGLRLLKYGNLHGNILGLEVVQANGEIVNILNTLKKDNTGYHLKNLFIGSEGTLGIVTKVVTQCRVRPKSTNVAFLGLQNFDKVVKTFMKAKWDMQEVLTAFEVMDAPSVELVRDNLKMPSPIGEYPFYVLIETTGSDHDYDTQKLESFLEECLEKHLILNGTTTGDSAKYQGIWNIREKIPTGFGPEGHVFMYDLSTSLDHYYQIVVELREFLGSRSQRVFGYGHLGDGNLHLHASAREYSPELERDIESFLHEKMRAYNGSISAEHGLGFAKGKYLTKIKPPNVVNIMRNIKTLMDPNGILNPYKTVY